MKILASIALTTISILSFAQTDIIEMRSRNASLKKYERITRSKSVDHVVSNFGMAPTIEVQNAVLDSVKCISDSTAIIYTSTYCWEAPITTSIIEEERNKQNGQGQRQRYVENGIGELWQPGADTVVNHPIFTHRHSLDSIKEVIDQDYYFNLPSDSIKFIGFDNAQSQSNSDHVLPVKHKRQKKNSIGWELIFMLVTPILFMFVIGRFVIPKSSITK